MKPIHHFETPLWPTSAIWCDCSVLFGHTGRVSGLAVPCIGTKRDGRFIAQETTDEVLQAAAEDLEEQLWSRGGELLARVERFVEECREDRDKPCRKDQP